MAALATAGGVDWKAELLKLKPCVQRARFVNTALRKKVYEAQNKYPESIEGEKKRWQEVTKNIIDGANCEANKLQEQVGKVENSLKAALRVARKQVGVGVHLAVTSPLRAHVKEESWKLEVLFKKLNQVAADIPLAEICNLAEKTPGAELTASQFESDRACCTAGASKLSLLELLQESLRCVKDMAITNAFQVKEGRTLRKLAV